MARLLPAFLMLLFCVAPCAAQQQAGGNFFERLGAYYRQDWNPSPPPAATPDASTAPAKRGLPSPEDSPPIPFSDWGYGGAPDIGAPDGNSYPLMTALDGSHGRTKLYGWINVSGNASTSDHSNLPLAYEIYPDRLTLNQGVVFLERLPDTVQTTHFDWGYHLTAFFGTDYRFTISKGILSDQLLKYNRQYGFDPMAEYADLYFPVKQGMNIRIGRFDSIPGIESTFAPSNYTVSHSILSLTDPFTVTGAVVSLKTSAQWLVQLGITAGGDVAPWTSDAKPSAVVCLNYSTASNSDNFYACANGINSGKYAFDNAQMYDLTWYHKFNAKWHSGAESWFMYQRDVPNIAGNVENPVPTETGANGAYCGPGELRCTAPAYAAIDYITRELTPHTMIGFRNELENDKKGQRTGIPGKYTENTLYFTKYFGSTVELRPELRFDHSWDRRGYNNGEARNQLFAAADVIFRF